MSFQESSWHPLVSEQPGEPRLLHQYFEQQVALRPEKTAIEFVDETLTYQELDRGANQLANYLAARGIGPGTLVGIFLKKSPRLYAAMLGILKAGAGYVPIDPRSPLDRARAISEDAELRLIITEGDLADQIDALATPLLRLDREREALLALPSTPVTPAPATDLSGLCYVIFTSGSTGRPKGVMIEHRNAVNFVKSLDTVYRLTENDRIYQGFSIAFDASVEEIWAAFSRGGTLVVPTEEIERSPADVAQFIVDKRITYYSTVPTMLAMIDRDLPTVTTLILGGEACSNELVARWAKPGRRMLNTYGPTEATVVATWSECVKGQPVSIGKPLPGYSVYVLNEDLQQVAPGESGELFIGGASIARGYMKLEELTSQRFIPNPFASGSGERLYRTYDHVKLGEDGELYFLGRLDDQVKIRGFRIELSEIESILLENPQIKAAAVGVVEVGGLKELAAFVVCNGDPASLDREKVGEQLRARVPAYMVPHYLDVVDDLPMMPSGKVNRKALPEPRTLLKGQSDIVAPANDHEAKIAACWAEAFRLPEVSVTDDFFLDLGGHSLLASQAVSQMRVAMPDMHLSVRDIYEHRTVRDLSAALLARAGAKQPEASRVAPQRNAFASVHPLTRWTTAALQAVAVTLYYGIVAAPFAYIILMCTAVSEGHIEWVTAAEISTALAFAAWPAMLLFSIGLKWLVIGRLKPGRYPLWSFYYFRWWLVTRFQALSWADMFAGSPLMSLYWRAMGANIGRDVTLSTSISGAFDMVKIGSGSSIGVETQLLGYRVEDGYLLIAPIEIGANCFIGMHCSLGLDTKMGTGARLDDMSLLPDGTIMQAGEDRRGSPAKPAQVDVPVRAKQSWRVTTFIFGVLHLVLVYVMGYFLIATMIPSIALIVAGLLLAGPVGGIIGALIAVPVGVLTYAFAAIGFVRLLRPIKPGVVRLRSLKYLRHWFISYLLENTKTILLPVYSTIYCPPLLRALGAKIGRGSEISTVTHITPNLLQVGEGSFLADACLVGGHRINGGVVEVGAVSIGNRSFIGNSALVPGGRSIGNNALIGVASTPPAGETHVPDDTRWLGSPGFALPNTQRNVCFDNSKIFKPTRWAVMARTLIDTMRILLPGFIFAAQGIAFAAYLVLAYHALPIWAIAASVPLVASALAVTSVLAAALVKEVFAGETGPVVKPLWCPFIWNNELVNGVYEVVGATAMTPLLGTPFIAPCLRLMGCRIGRWCFVETTLFSEFDLVEIGDRACLNLGSTVQTHLFEDRVFKADYIKIGDDCSIGNMAVVLYSTEMKAGASLGPLSVLMKGEMLPAATRWIGTPCEPAAAHDDHFGDVVRQLAAAGNRGAWSTHAPRFEQRLKLATR